MRIDLDPEQDRAARAPEGRVLVLSGAGSGKTRLLTARVCWLRDDCNVPGARIACLTFSKSAAEEMAYRLVGDSGFFPDEKVGPGGMYLGTIHALGLKILGSVFRGRTVADGPMSLRLMQRALKELKAGKDHKAGDVLKRLAAAKSSFAPWPPDIAAFCEKYQSFLREFRMFDFTDLLSESVRLLEDRDEVRASWQGKYQHILVDEAQDTSPVQWRLIRNLLRPTTSLFAVGDLGQSIYAFRGARPEHLLDDLDRTLGPWTTYPLTRNYRSVPDVIGLANAISAGRRGMVEITPTRGSTRRPAGEPALEMGWYGSADQEATAGVGVIQRTLAAWEGLELGEIAVLCRTNAQIEPWEAACVAARLPYVVAGGFSFYQRSEVADVIAWMQVATLTSEKPENRGVFLTALERIYNRPSRYLGKVWREELEQQGGWDQFLRGGPLTWKLGYQKRNVDALYEAITVVRRVAREGSACDVARHIIDGDLGYRRWAVSEKENEPTSEQDSYVSENLDAILQGATRFPKPADYLEFVDLCKARGGRRTVATTTRIVLSTIHRAKGLEWPFVVVAGVIDGKLPHILGMEDEERRLFYVAVTRAGDRLLVCGSDEPSRFVADLMGWPVLADPPAESEQPALPVLLEGGRDDQAQLPFAEGDSDRPRGERITGTGTHLRLVGGAAAAGGGPPEPDAGTGGETDGE